MRNTGLMRIPLSEDSFLASAGIMSGCGSEAVSKVFTEQAVMVFAAIANAGSDGLAIAQIGKLCGKDYSLAVLPLEIEGLVEWEYNARGQKANLKLTWKGQDALEASRPKPIHNTLASRRAAIQRRA